MKIEFNITGEEYIITQTMEIFTVNKFTSKEIPDDVAVVRTSVESTFWFNEPEWLDEELMHPQAFYVDRGSDHIEPEVCRTKRQEILSRCHKDKTVELGPYWRELKCLRGTNLPAVGRINNGKPEIVIGRKGEDLSHYLEEQ